MRSVRYLILIFSFAILLLSCRRRPLTDADNNVEIAISINTDIVNYTVHELPSMMRVMFFDNETGKFSTQAFVPPTGGTVNVVPGRTYDVLVYNFDTESTIIYDENEFGNIYATTNSIPENYRDILKSRGSKYDNERIVFEPDHLFAGCLNDVYIPAKGTESDRIVLEVEASTVVESWTLLINKVKGVEWISSVHGVISGLSEGNKLSANRKMDGEVSVFFETLETGSDGVLKVRFNTFGYLPEMKQITSIVIIDISGKGHEFNIDTSEWFIDNEEQVIEIITDKIVIEKPETGEGGGGLQPDLDDWENIETDIII